MSGRQSFRATVPLLRRNAVNGRAPGPLGLLHRPVYAILPARASVEVQPGCEGQPPGRPSARGTGTCGRDPALDAPVHYGEAGAALASPVAGALGTASPSKTRETGRGGGVGLPAVLNNFFQAQPSPPEALRQNQVSEQSRVPKESGESLPSSSCRSFLVATFRFLQKLFSNTTLPPRSTQTKQSK